ncbi:MAG: putative DNA modification/repair radical SAM protein [Clostridiales Family XIII bacterium]|nr:putative DNA modification/repair radical SAM protein [Clostridiales Family XIII bacterium]
MESNLLDKLTILGESAKYDVSCSSSGANRAGMGRIGSAACAGICHSWTADGRCMSLLKVLQSNDCVYNCRYCVNRRTSDAKRATFEPHELADITMEFYRRNYIEGLFLSSAVRISPDHTAELMLKTLCLLREIHLFNGYIHTKVIPGVAPELLHAIGLYSDRLSVNVELPSSGSLSQLAPQKTPEHIFAPMRQITRTQFEQKTLRSAGNRDRFTATSASGWNAEAGDGFLEDLKREVAAEAGMRNLPALIDRRKHYKEKFAPAGQTTQMIIGASPETDRHIMKTSEALYRRFSMKRVYFSAYIPVVSDPALPPQFAPPNLKREHRLYQADWLLRFYGFTADEILTEDEPNLDYELDPKIIWALRHIEVFPLEVNTASFEELLRIPGVGSVSAKRIMQQRRIRAVRYEDLKKMGVVLKRARYFLTCVGKYYGEKELEPVYIRDRVLRESREAAARFSGLPTVADASEMANLPAPSVNADVPLLDANTIRASLSGTKNGAQISMFDALAPAEAGG